MYALEINGRPRVGGNTEMLLHEVLKPLAEKDWETEFIQVGGTGLRGCTACSNCFKTKDNSCIMKNDEFNGIFTKMLRATAIIIGSPTYFADITAETKALLDRAGYVAFANDRAFKGKIGAAVIAVRRGGAVHAYDSINHMYLMSQMVVPGSIYWNIGFGLRREDAKEDAEGLLTMNVLGRTIDILGKAIEPLANSWPVA